MKRLVSCLILTALPFSAQASTDLARQWGQEASRLSMETTEMIYAVDIGQPLELSETFALDVYRFGRTSADLARWVDGARGPQDLACIFRGMATESEDQLMALEGLDGIHAQRESLSRLAALFSNAQRVAVVAQRPAASVRIAQPTSPCTP
jgi:hypothetical protein